MTKYTENNF